MGYQGRGDNRGGNVEDGGKELVNSKDLWKSPNENLLFCKTITLKIVFKSLIRDICISRQ